ncbi:MAG: hypothetical protein SWJ54_16040, partial [Cyanobacteriota bacterium]|nr:hypothetical protein [Cyanobacteriota bacterium]
EDYASNDWDSESTNYETVDSLPNSIDGYYSESQLTTDDPYSSEYSSEEGYRSSPASEYPDYSTPASYSNDYSSPAPLDSSSYSSESSWEKPEPADEIQSVESYGDDPVSDAPYRSDYSVDTYSDIKPESSTSSQPKWGTEYNPSSLDSDFDSETEVDYEIPSDPLSVPKFETQS